MNFGRILEYSIETGLGWVQPTTGAAIPFIVNVGTTMPAVGALVSFGVSERAHHIQEEKEPAGETTR